MKEIFSVLDIFSPGMSLQEIFSLEIRVKDIFFLNHLYPSPLPLKSQMVVALAFLTARF